jgi:amino acid adenylation domain-containing protein
VRIGDLSLLTPSSAAILPKPRQRLDDSRPGAIHARFCENARRAPERPAVVDRGRVESYGDLDAWSTELARRLAATGVRARDLVAVYGHRSAALVCALLGALKAGAAFVILDPAYPERHLVSCLRLANPRGFIQLAGAGTLPAAVEGLLLASGCRRLVVPDRPGTTASVDAGAAPAAGADDPAYVAFTSGTSGEPKAIVGSHWPVAHFIDWQCRTFDLGAGDRFSMLSGLSHDPLLRDIFMPLALGATLYIPEHERLTVPGWLTSWIQQHSITVMHLTPALGRIVTDGAPGGAAGGGGLERLRYAFFGGDPLAGSTVASLRRLAPHVTCVNLYGATETPQGMGYYIVPDGDPPETVPVGTGIEGVQLLVMGEPGRQAGIGEVGEICVRTPYLSRGYLGDEALTRSRFVRNPFTAVATDLMYRTGDMGRYCPDGSVDILGRRDDQVKIRGFRIEPRGIEALLGAHPAVKSVAVVAREDAPGDRRLVAYVVPVDGRHDVGGELLLFLRENLPGYMVPSAIVMLDAIPLTQNAKVDRAALPVPDGHRPGQGGAFGPPRTKLERAVARVWREVLKLDRVGVDDNFFDLGGHSLLLAQVNARLREDLGCDLPVVDMFRYPTVRALASFLGQPAADGAGGDRSPAAGLRRPAARPDRARVEGGRERIEHMRQLRQGGRARKRN